MQMPERTITVLPPEPEYLLQMIRQKQRFLRVAAYGRVSTNDEEQLSSYEAQLSYYTDLINSKEEWRMVGVFADEGITGTSALKRPEFLKLMELCKKGKVDLILVKSISRFARNTLDCITYIRMLKEHNVTVIFEKEGINTSEMTSEVMLTFLAAFAQAESESISGNITWGKRKAFQDGKVTYQYSRLLGYERGEDGQPKVNSEQAETVRFIYKSYLAGLSLAMIKTTLEDKGMPSTLGSPEWSISKIQRVLQNEMYTGDAILQKTYTADCISKTRKVNTGEVPKYYVKDCHEAIIDRDTFRMVQAEIARRSGKQKVSQKPTKTENGKYSGKYALSSILVCGNCGAHYKRVTWARNGSKKIVWRCISRLEFGTKYCKDSPTLDEERLHAAIIRAMNRLAENKDEVIASTKEFIRLALDGAENGAIDRAATENRIRELQTDMVTLMQKCAESSEGVDAYDAQFKALSDEIKQLQSKLVCADGLQQNRNDVNARLNYVLSAIVLEDFSITEYNDRLTRLLVDRITVLSTEELRVSFKEFGEIEVRV